jgi:hypothetical protein
MGTERVVRLQSGRLLDYGNVRLVGMSKEDLQDAVGLYSYSVAA